MANLSFSSQGALPSGNGPQLTVGPGTSGASPFSNALTQAKFGSNYSVGNTAPPSIPAPSTAVKSTTINNPDGSSHVTTYHAPDTGQVDATKTTSTTSGLIGNSTGTTAPSTATPPTFPGIVGSLANTSTGGSANATNATTGLLGSPDQNAQIANQARDIGTTYGNNISKISNYGDALAGSYTNGAGLAPVSQGLAGQAQQTTAAEVQGQQAAENAALAPLNQELAAQNQAQSGLASAGGIANTQQGQVQSGLTSAGSLAQPQLGSIGQVPFSPTEGSQGAVLGSTQPGGVAAAGNLLGQLQGAQAAGAAPGQAQASNIQTSGTAITGANAKGLADSIQQETELNTAATNASALANQVSDALKNSGLDMTNSTDANTALNNLQSRLGNAAYTQLNIAVNDARNAYAAILQSTGSTPTDAGDKANQNISANMSPKQILGAIDQLTQGVNARQTSAHQQTQNYKNQLNGSGSSGGGSNGSTSGFGWNG